MTKDTINNIKEIALDLTISGGISTALSQVWTETIHIFFVLLGAVISTGAMFFFNRWLKHKFPEKK